MGERVWSEAFVTVADPDLSKLFDQNTDGLLGADLLLIHGALIDFSSWTLWLPPERHARR